MQPAFFGNVRDESLDTIVSRMRDFRHYAKKSTRCLIAVDEEYIRDYMDVAENFESVPYPIKHNPNYEKDAKGL